ncbi:DNA translocase FtsK [Methylococcus mesophilus]|uniref:DNA translocase FtsK n=1 Tax=Methylococcus mesophilus TaxID=2993564 RepID=UPI0029393F3F|nr:DNA translocase FtsK 4TM domain-containing protein [Methylococcus mesophilus]
MTPADDLRSSLVRTLREGAFLAYLALASFFLIALVTFDLEDAGWTHTGSRRSVSNGAGAVGAWLSDFSFCLFGIMAYLLPLLLAGYGYRIYRGRRAQHRFSLLDSTLRWLGLGAAIAAGSGIVDLQLLRVSLPLPETTGGIVGRELADLVTGSFGVKGASVLLGGAFLAGVSLATGLSWLKLVDVIGQAVLTLVRLATTVPAFLARDRQQPLPAPSPPQPAAAAPVKPRQGAARPARPQEQPAAPQHPAEPAAQPSEPAAPRAPVIPFLQPKKPPAVPVVRKPASGALPALSLLNDTSAKVHAYSPTVLQQMSELVETILADFGVDVEVVSVHPGPVITRFELQPAAGVKVSRISGLAKDLARALSVTSVRVVEVIPGKSVVGLEIPNREREIVLLHSVLASDAYQQAPSPLTLVLGKDISGHPVVANLAKMPHLLVAGTTGSGKSVAINVMILSLLYKAGPAEVRLIMIDPKMLELSVYEGIPHLLTPVVTDMKEAANALRWCVAEMERRYKLMSLVGVRNLEGFNQRVREAAEAGKPLRDPLWNPNLALGDEEPPQLEPLPCIVIVIDELADMMMIVGKKVEELIARLAQKARAAGLHLILATQRPSVDVITGLIKANIPTRIAFQVSSRIDSRTIIDQGGAEALLGNGDMLYLPPGTGFPQRAHGAFVSDHDVHKVVEFLKGTGEPDYIEDITRFSEDSGDGSGFRGGNGDGGGGDEGDALYDEAVRFVTESRKASISSVQRRFKVGYNRAARMIEDMERAGVVTPADTNGSRQVLAPPPPPV